MTPLNAYLGYEEAASIAKQALAERKTIRQVVLERGHVADGRLTEAQLDEALDVDAHDAPLTVAHVAAAVAPGARQERVADLGSGPLRGRLARRVHPDEQVPADVRPQDA